MFQSDTYDVEETIDKSKIPPIQQKRILAFVNHFIVESVDFLNRFATDCEMKFVDFEVKLDKVEDSLLILESKLSSISELKDFQSSIKEEPIPTPTPRVTINKPDEPESEQKSATKSLELEEKERAEELQNEVQEQVQSGVKACDDFRYRKYFKMVQFGIPVLAVKQKMSCENLNPDILDEPNKILPDGQTTNPEPEPDSSEEDDTDC